jgi:hypothetical protein
MVYCTRAVLSETAIQYQEECEAIARTLEQLKYYRLTESLQLEAETTSDNTRYVINLYFFPSIKKGEAPIWYMLKHKDQTIGYAYITAENDVRIYTDHPVIFRSECNQTVRFNHLIVQSLNTVHVDSKISANVLSVLSEQYEIAEHVDYDVNALAIFCGQKLKLNGKVRAKKAAVLRAGTFEIAESFRLEVPEGAAHLLGVHGKLAGLISAAEGVKGVFLHGQEHAEFIVHTPKAFQVMAEQYNQNGLSCVGNYQIQSGWASFKGSVLASKEMHILTREPLQQMPTSIFICNTKANIQSQSSAELHGKILVNASVHAEALKIEKDQITLPLKMTPQLEQRLETSSIFLNYALKHDPLLTSPMSYSMTPVGKKQIHIQAKLWIRYTGGLEAIDSAVTFHAQNALHLKGSIKQRRANPEAPMLKTLLKAREVTLAGGIDTDGLLGISAEEKFESTALSSLTAELLRLDIHRGLLAGHTESRTLAINATDKLGTTKTSTNKAKTAIMHLERFRNEGRFDVAGQAYIDAKWWIYNRGGYIDAQELTLVAPLIWSVLGELRGRELLNAQGYISFLGLYNRSGTLIVNSLINLSPLVIIQSLIPRNKTQALNLTLTLSNILFFVLNTFIPVSMIATVPIQIVMGTLMRSYGVLQALKQIQATLPEVMKNQNSSNTIQLTNSIIGLVTAAISGTIAGISSVAGLQGNFTAAPIVNTAIDVPELFLQAGAIACGYLTGGHFKSGLLVVDPLAAIGGGSVTNAIVSVNAGGSLGYSDVNFSPFQFDVGFHGLVAPGLHRGFYSVQGGTTFSPFGTTQSFGTIWDVGGFGPRYKYHVQTDRLHVLGNTEYEQSSISADDFHIHKDLTLHRTSLSSNIVHVGSGAEIHWDHVSGRIGEFNVAPTARGYLSHNQLAIRHMHLLGQDSIRWDDNLILDIYDITIRGSDLDASRTTFVAAKNHTATFTALDSKVGLHDAIFAKDPASAGPAAPAGASPIPFNAVTKKAAGPDVQPTYVMLPSDDQKSWHFHFDGPETNAILDGHTSGDVAELRASQGAKVTVAEDCAFHSLLLIEAAKDASIRLTDHAVGVASGHPNAFSQVRAIDGGSVSLEDKATLRHEILPPEKPGFIQLMTETDPKPAVYHPPTRPGHDWGIETKKDGHFHMGNGTYADASYLHEGAGTKVDIDAGALIKGLLQAEVGGDATLNMHGTMMGAEGGGAPVLQTGENAHINTEGGQLIAAHQIQPIYRLATADPASQTTPQEVSHEAPSVEAIPHPAHDSPNAEPIISYVTTEQDAQHPLEPDPMPTPPHHEFSETESALAHETKNENASTRIIKTGEDWHLIFGKNTHWIQDKNSYSEIGTWDLITPETIDFHGSTISGLKVFRISGADHHIDFGGVRIIGGFCRPDEAAPQFYLVDGCIAKGTLSLLMPAGLSRDPQAVAKAWQVVIEGAKTVWTMGEKSLLDLSTLHIKDQAQVIESQGSDAKVEQATIDDKSSLLVLGARFTAHQVDARGQIQYVAAQANIDQINLHGQAALALDATRYQIGSVHFDGAQQFSVRNCTDPDSTIGEIKDESHRQALASFDAARGSLGELKTETPENFNFNQTHFQTDHPDSFHGITHREALFDDLTRLPQPVHAESPAAARHAFDAMILAQFGQRTIDQRAAFDALIGSRYGAEVAIQDSYICYRGATAPLRLDGMRYLGVLPVSITTTGNADLGQFISLLPDLEIHATNINAYHAAYTGNGLHLYAVQFNAQDSNFASTGILAITASGRFNDTGNTHYFGAKGTLLGGLESVSFTPERVISTYVHREWHGHLRGHSYTNVQVESFLPSTVQSSNGKAFIFSNGDITTQGLSGQSPELIHMRTEHGSVRVADVVGRIIADTRSRGPLGLGYSRDQASHEFSQGGHFIGPVLIEAPEGTATLVGIATDGKDFTIRALNVSDLPRVLQHRESHHAWGISYAFSVSEAQQMMHAVFPALPSMRNLAASHDAFSALFASVQTGTTLTNHAYAALRDRMCGASSLQQMSDLVVGDRQHYLRSIFDSMFGVRCSLGIVSSERMYQTVAPISRHASGTVEYQAQQRATLGVDIEADRVRLMFPEGRLQRQTLHAESESTQLGLTVSLNPSGIHTGFSVQTQLGEQDTHHGINIQARELTVQAQHLIAQNAQVSAPTLTPDSHIEHLEIDDLMDRRQSSGMSFSADTKGAIGVGISELDEHSDRSRTRFSIAGSSVLPADHTDQNALMPYHHEHKVDASFNAHHIMGNDSEEKTARAVFGQFGSINYEHNGRSWQMVIPSFHARDAQHFAGLVQDWYHEHRGTEMTADGGDALQHHSLSRRLGPPVHPPHTAPRIHPRHHAPRLHHETKEHHESKVDYLGHLNAGALFAEYQGQQSRTHTVARSVEHTKPSHARAIAPHRASPMRSHASINFFPVAYAATLDEGGHYLVSSQQEQGVSFTSLVSRGIAETFRQHEGTFAREFNVHLQREAAFDYFLRVDREAIAEEIAEHFSHLDPKTATDAELRSAYHRLPNKTAWEIVREPWDSMGTGNLRSQTVAAADRYARVLPYARAGLNSLAVGTAVYHIEQAAPEQRAEVLGEQTGIALGARAGASIGAYFAEYGLVWRGIKFGAGQGTRAGGSVIGTLAGGVLGGICGYGATLAAQHNPYYEAASRGLYHAYSGVRELVLHPIDHLIMPVWTVSSELTLGNPVPLIMGATHFRDHLIQTGHHLLWGSGPERVETLTELGAFYYVQNPLFRTRQNFGLTSRPPLYHDQFVINSYKNAEFLTLGQLEDGFFYPYAIDPTGQLRIARAYTADERRTAISDLFQNRPIVAGGELTFDDGIMAWTHEDLFGEYAPGIQFQKPYQYEPSSGGFTESQVNALQENLQALDAYLTNRSKNLEHLTNHVFRRYGVDANGHYSVWSQILTNTPWALARTGAASTTTALLPDQKFEDGSQMEERFPARAELPSIGRHRASFFGPQPSTLLADIYKHFEENRDPKMTFDQRR